MRTSGRAADLLGGLCFLLWGSGGFEIHRARSIAPLESAGLPADFFVKIKPKLSYISAHLRPSPLPLTLLNYAC
jgi:hypothetical protein